MSTPIHFFKDEFAFLSNFYPINITIKEKLWLTSEHMYMACKTRSPIHQENTRLMATPGQAKRYARKVTLRDDWDTVKFDVMLRILRHKFTLNQECHDKLLSTGDIGLIEGNFWHDNIWGNCSCPKCKSIVGANHLGKLLMQVRNELGEAQHV